MSFQKRRQNALSLVYKQESGLKRSIEVKKVLQKTIVRQKKPFNLSTKLPASWEVQFEMAPIPSCTSLKWDFSLKCALSMLPEGLASARHFYVICNKRSGHKDISTTTTTLPSIDLQGHNPNTHSFSTSDVSTTIDILSSKILGTSTLLLFKNTCSIPILVEVHDLCGVYMPDDNQDLWKYTTKIFPSSWSDSSECFDFGMLLFF